MSYIKKPEEIKKILEGGKLVGEILEKLAGMVAPGVSGAELDIEAERLIRANGGMPAFKGYRTRKSDPPFPGTICFSLNEELVHGIPTKEKIIKSGDIVSIDIGMRYPGEKGLFTDTAVTVAVGSVPKEVKKLLGVTQEALEVGIGAVKLGGTIADIGRAIEQYVNKQGKYGIVRDLVGHGVGHAVHEEPRVPNYEDRSLESWKIEPGAVIAIEPMISLGGYAVETADDQWTIFMADKSMSAHVEHTIVVTENGPVVATRRPSER
jgi:methionyl aminopeptidase